MNKKYLTAILLACVSINVYAENPTFDYFDIGYVTWRPDGVSLSNSPSGIDLKVSKEFNDNLYFAGDLNYVSKNNNSISLVTAGVGYLNNFSEISSFFAELDLAFVDPTFGGSETGYEATIGLRSIVANNFELKGAIEYLDINNGDTSVNLGTAYYFTDKIGLYFDYKINQDVHRFALGLRATF